MAHFLEHIVHRGTEHFPDPRSHIQSLGGQLQATTRPDVTQFVIKTPADVDALTQVLSIEADRMAGRATLTNESIQAEKKVVRNELLQHDENSFLTLQHSLYQTAFGQYGHGYDVRGPIESVADISQPSLRSFYRRHYRPSNATVIVVGGVSATDVKEAVAKTISSVENPSDPPPTFEFHAPDGATENRISMSQPGAMPGVAVLLRGVNATHRHYPTLVAIHRVLAHGEDSRLHRALVDSGLAARVTSISILTRDASTLYFAAEASEGVQPERLVDAVQDELDDISTGRRPISPQELTSVIDEPHQWSQMSALGISSQLGHGAAAGDWRLFFSLPQAIKSLTPEEVAEVAPSILHPAQRTLGILRSSNATPLPTDATESSDSTWIDHFAGAELFTQDLAFHPMSAREIDQRIIHRTTPSGLEVSLLQVPAPKATAILTMPVVENAESTHGLWALTSSLIPRSTHPEGSETLRDRLAKRDSSLTCSYANGFLQISLTSPPSEVLDALGLTIGALQSFHVDDAVFEKWRRSLASGSDAGTQDIFNIATKQALRALYGDELASRGLSSLTPRDRQEISRLQKKHVVTAIEKVVGSDWAYVSIVGDVDPERVETSLESTWTGSAEVRRKSPEKVGSETHGEILVTNAKGLTVDVGVLALEIDSDMSASDIMALSLASSVLGGASGASILMRGTRDEQGLSYQTGSVFSPPSRHRHGSWLIHAVTEKGSGEAGLLSLQDALDDLRRSGLEPEAFMGVKKSLLQQRDGILSTPKGVAALMSQAAIEASSVDEILQQELMDSIGIDDVNEALRKHVHSDAMSRIIVAGI